jgi:hypothetical protein
MRYHRQREFRRSLKSLHLPLGHTNICSAYFSVK